MHRRLDSRLICFDMITTTKCQSSQFTVNQPTLGRLWKEERLSLSRKCQEEGCSTMQIGLVLLSTLILVLQDYSSSFLVPSPVPTRSCRHRTFVSVATRTNARKKKYDDNDDDDDDTRAPGMEEAFRELDNLVESKGEDAGQASTTTPPSSPISADKDVVPDTTTTQALTPEREAGMYTKLMEDLEVTDDDELYSDVMAELGGDSSEGRKPAPASSSSSMQSLVDSTTTAGGTNMASSKADMDKFMDEALSEALKEVKLKSSESLSSESILNDDKIMKEIEAIFDRGNEQLMESLEEIRQEQVRQNICIFWRGGGGLHIMKVCDY